MVRIHNMEIKKLSSFYSKNFEIIEHSIFAKYRKEKIKNIFLSFFTKLILRFYNKYIMYYNPNCLREN